MLCKSDEPFLLLQLLKPYSYYYLLCKSQLVNWRAAQRSVAMHAMQSCHAHLNSPRAWGNGAAGVHSGDVACCLGRHKDNEGTAAACHSMPCASLSSWCLRAPPVIPLPQALNPQTPQLYLCLQPSTPAPPALTLPPAPHGCELSPPLALPLPPALNPRPPPQPYLCLQRRTDAYCLLHSRLGLVQGLHQRSLAHSGPTGNHQRPPQQHKGR